MRILHFSDPHFNLSLRTMPLKKWIGKRAFGALNLLAGRGGCFDQVEDKIVALNQFKNDFGVDLVLCTGDYTSFGSDAELRHSAKCIEPLRDVVNGFITVPGNHDIYTKDVIRAQSFSKYFSSAMSTDLPQYDVGDGWPFVRLIGDDVAVIAVNSAKPNPIPWRSDGHIPSAQLESLKRILDDVCLEGRFIFIMTHYAPRREDGTPDSKLHGLQNADELLSVCRPISRGALLCGHIHRPYRTQIHGLNIDLYCAGSVTKNHSEGFWLFDVENGVCSARQGAFDLATYSYFLKDLTC